MNQGEPPQALHLHECDALRLVPESSQAISDIALQDPAWKDVASPRTSCRNTLRTKPGRACLSSTYQGAGTLIRQIESNIHARPSRFYLGKTWPGADPSRSPERTENQEEPAHAQHLTEPALEPEPSNSRVGGLHDLSLQRCSLAPGSLAEYSADKEPALEPDR
jgi:hypothetical protein